MAQSLDSMTKNLQKFYANDELRDGVVINTMEVLTFIAAVRIGAELWNKSVDQYLGFIGPLQAINSASQGPKSGSSTLKKTASALWKWNLRLNPVMFSTAWGIKGFKAIKKKLGK